MPVLKEDEIKDVWKEATGLMRLEADNKLQVNWGNREQIYQWANDIEYEFDVKIENTQKLFKLLSAIKDGKKSIHEAQKILK